MLAKQGANRVPRDNHSNCRASVEKSIRLLQTIVIIYHIKTRESMKEKLDKCYFLVPKTCSLLYFLFWLGLNAGK